MEKLLFTEDYLEDVLVRFAHHSSAIEGNTLSLVDTVSIILHNTVPGKTNLRELYEVANHKDAFEYIMNNVENHTEMSLTIIKDIHNILMDKLLIDKGKFKAQENTIKGSEINTASPQKTPYLMKQWVDNLKYQLEHADMNKDIIRIVVDFHIQFERIHPFTDGNGRAGRLLMNYVLMERGIPPLIIRLEDKSEYINILSKGDVDKFTVFATELIQEECKRMEKFINKDKNIEL